MLKHEKTKKERLEKVASLWNKSKTRSSTMHSGSVIGAAEADVSAALRILLREDVSAALKIFFVPWEDEPSQ